MKILLTGKNGQVGYELERSLQGLGEVVALERTHLNLSDLRQVREVIRSVRPNLIVNPAAYTAVDKAESEIELAMCINGDAPGVMAEEAKKLGAAMIHYSTDYVFDGSKSSPYVEEDAPNPISAYGKTKLAGEEAIRAVDIPHLIFRTSWVYGLRGRNFLLTVLRLAQERDELRIVADQIGAPTWSRTLADTTAHIVSQARAAKDSQQWWAEHGGLYHLTAQGSTSWHGFTEAILSHPAVTKKPRVVPITTDDYPLPAPRPRNSVLNCDKLKQRFCDLPHWEAALALCQGA